MAKTDLTKLREAVAEVKARATELETFQRYGHDLYIVTEKLKLVRMNAAWIVVTGFDEKELIGKNWLDYTHAEDQHIITDELAVLNKTPARPVGFITRLRTSKGPFTWVKWNAAVDRENQDHVVAIGRVMTALEITEHPSAGVQ